MRILVVTRDIMAGKFLAPVVEKLRHRQHEVIIVAEGKSLSVWDAAHIVPDYSFTEEVCWNVNVSELFESIGRIDLTLVGCSYPSNLERKFAVLANERNIPLGAYPDTWGARKRLGDVIVDLILSIDGYSVAIDGKDAKNAVVTGDPSVAALETIGSSISPELLEYFQGQHLLGKKVIVLVGQDPSFADDLLRVTVDCLKRSPEWNIIPRLVHPKFPDQRVTDLWECRKVSLDPSRILSNCPPATTDQLVYCADATISVSSTALRTTAFAGKLPISVVTSQTIAGMMSETGIDHYPLAQDMGYAVEISHGMNINKLHVRHAGEYFEGLRFAATRGADAIEAFISH